jgi:hypothetical protein
VKFKLDENFSPSLAGLFKAGELRHTRYALNLAME